MRRKETMRKSVAFLSRWGQLSAALLVLGGLFVAGSGCGGGDASRYHLSGNVTYGGQPVPAGSVTFIPDTAQGNSGPAVSTRIENGRFDTRRTGTGHVGGPHIVKITGLDGHTGDEFFPQGMPMFPDYEMPVDLPNQNGTQDLEVPSDWVAPPTKGQPRQQPTA
jgi:hypothetical protein